MDQSLHFGVLILQDSSWPAIVERAQGYEAIGLDSVWIADHFVSPWSPGGPWFECWTLLSALATRTSRIRLGPLATHAVYRNPALLARQALTVDHISGGRLTLAMGAGASHHDWLMTAGNDPWAQGERFQRFREAIELVDRLLREDMTTYDGRYYRVRGAAMHPRPCQHPRPPLTVAARGPRMVKLAARYADTWNTEAYYEEVWRDNAAAADVFRITRGRAELLAEEAAALGRDPRSIVRSLLLGYAPGLEAPWASPAAVEEVVGRYREIGFTEFILPEPRVSEAAVFERAVREVIPALRGATVI